MPACSAYGCTNRPSTKSKQQQTLEASGLKITFHRIPKNEALKKLWVEAIRRKDWIPSTNSVLCSMHFTEADFDRTSLSVVRLRENAVPSIFKAFPSYLQVSKHQSKRKPPSKRKYETAPVTSTSAPVASTSRAPPVAQTNQSDYSLTAVASEFPEHDSTIPKSITRSTSVSPESKRKRFESPTKELMRQSFKIRQQKYIKKIKTLQRTKIRHKKVITNLKKLLLELKSTNLLCEDGYEIMNNIPTFHKQLLKRQIQKRKNVPLPRQYESEIRSFALTLHYYSPAAYNFVRREYNSCLPHPKTLYRWYKSIDGNPGFTSEAFQAIKNRCALSKKQIVCSLVIDEMAIYQSASYSGEEYFGYVNMGTGTDLSSNQIASQALVFLLVAINDNWKIPVAYFLCNGVRAEEKKTLILHCVQLATEAGTRVVNLTLDGTSTNLATVRSLGCKLDPCNELQTYFEHPDNHQNIYVFLDPCHMLKLVRNTLGELKTIQWDEEYVDWKFVKFLHILQHEEGLHLGNKLKTAHINFYKQKMKVRLASQVFSESVADAIELCCEKINIPDFQNSQKTVLFIRMMNNIFDIFNSKSERQIGFRRALSKDNKENVFKYLRECQTILQTLKLENENVLEHRRRTGFLGFIICINSLIHMFEDICEKEQILSFIPTYRLNQDHLELLFGTIRRHGGCSNNPTALQFRSAYRKILVHTQLKEDVSGNCVPLQNISILHCSSATPVESINNSTDKNTLIETLPENVINDHNYIPNFCELTIVSEYIVTYIAGFVVRHLKLTLKCEECKNALESTANQNEVYRLINQKNKGGLVYPSNDTIEICKKCESIIKFALNESGGKIMKQQYTKNYLINSFLHNTSERVFFRELFSHSLDQSPMENHQILLRKAVADYYIKIRLHYITKKSIDKSLSTRQLYNKLTLFKGY